MNRGLTFGLMMIATAWVFDKARFRGSFEGVRFPVNRRVLERLDGQRAFVAGYQAGQSDARDAGSRCKEPADFECVDAAISRSNKPVLDRNDFIEL